MATFNISQNGKAVKGRTTKVLPSVDLTAMVDLAFLLITFFMLTTSLSKMRAMDIVKPVPIENPIDLVHYPASRTMTILLGGNDQAVVYMGEASKAFMETISLATIKTAILANKMLVANSHELIKDQRMLVIIKPTNTSNYKNFVDVIDEMNIAKIETYAIDDKYLLSEETDFMKARGI